jgi:hypothetical protein
MKQPLCGRRKATGDRQNPGFLHFPFSLVPFLAVWAAVAAFSCSPTGSIVAHVNNDVVTRDEFAHMLSGTGGETPADSAGRGNLLNSIINQKLIVQRARELGYEDTLKGPLEKKWYEILRQSLTNYAMGLKPAPADIALESLLFVTDLHVKVLEVPTYDTAMMVQDLVKFGVPFESLAVRYNRSKFAPPDGDLGWAPAAKFPPAWLKAVQNLQPGQSSGLVVRGILYDFVKLDARRVGLAAESIAQYRPQIEALARQRKGGAFIDEIRARVTYDEGALDLLTGKPDSVRPGDMERVVASRPDGNKVRIGGLLPIVRGYGDILPALRRQALKEDIENDLLEREALRLKLDKTPEFRNEYRRQTEAGIYQYFYQHAIAGRALATEPEMRAEFQQHPEAYQGRTFDEVQDYLKERLTTDHRQRMYETMIGDLRRRGRITIDHKLLMQIKPEKK